MRHSVHKNLNSNRWMFWFLCKSRKTLNQLFVEIQTAIVIVQIFEWLEVSFEYLIALYEISNSRNIQNDHDKPSATLNRYRPRFFDQKMGPQTTYTYRKVASSIPVYYSILNHFWGATNWDVLLTETCYYCLVQQSRWHEFISIYSNYLLCT